MIVKNIYRPTDGFLNAERGVPNDASLSLKESGVPAERDDRDGLDAPIGTDLTERSLTCQILFYFIIQKWI